MSQKQSIFLIVSTRVARWHVFKPKIQIWVNFGGPWFKKVVLFYDHLEYFTAIWYILRPFGKLVAILEYFPCFSILNKEKSGNPGVHLRMYVSTLTNSLVSHCVDDIVNCNFLNIQQYVGLSTLHRSKSWALHTYICHRQLL
jgi:hypothetical protein